MISITTLAQKSLACFSIAVLSVLSGCATKQYEVSTSGGKYPVQLDTPKTEFSTPSQKDIEKIVEANLPKMQKCYEAGLLKNPNLAGKVIVHFVLQATGKISLIQVHETTLKDPMVESCLQFEVTKLHFPAFTKGSLDIYYPFIFRVKI